jgi:hypothetical protein
VDSAGNVYIADSMNNRIRKVAAATGIITTVAGNGTAGYSGDGGAATSAEINNPGGVAVDSAGNLYIADTVNSLIREVSASTGVISTLAGDLVRCRRFCLLYSPLAGYSGDGGPALGAQLNTPTAIRLDSAGNIYIADSGNGRIREVNASTGVINTVAGNGTLGFSGDGGAATSAELGISCAGCGATIALDSSGNLYIGDTGNVRVRVVGH